MSYYVSKPLIEKIRGKPRIFFYIAINNNLLSIIFYRKITLIKVRSFCILYREGYTSQLVLSKAFNLYFVSQSKHILNVIDPLPCDL